MPNLVLLRHGQSTWNFENRFTGWEEQLRPTHHTYLGDPDAAKKATEAVVPLCLPLVGDRLQHPTSKL